MKIAKPDPSAPPAWKAQANIVAEQLDADIVLYSGGIYPPSDVELMLEVVMNKYRKNVLLILTTFGGSGDSAYKIVRFLQKLYSHGEFKLYVHSVCKSAGTIIAVGAHQIIMTATAELGPLDVQVTKHDEVGERSSGLTPSQTLNFLRREAFSVFEETFNKLRYTNFRFPTRMAASIAAEMAIGLFKPLYEQMDPMRFGEIERAMMVAAEYGERIKTENLKKDALSNLMTKYPSHGFVIDRNEAAQLFSDIRDASPAEIDLMAPVSQLISEGQDRERRGESAVVKFLSSRPDALTTDDNSNAGAIHDNASKHESESSNSGPEGVSPNGELEPQQHGSHQG